MVDLVGVLSLFEFAFQHGIAGFGGAVIVKGFIGDHFDTFTAAGLLLGGVGHRVQLSDLVLRACGCGGRRLDGGGGGLARGCGGRRLDDGVGGRVRIGCG